MGNRLSAYNLEVPVKGRVYWYNTLTGASVLLSAKQLEILKENVVQDIPTGTNDWAAVISFLSRHGFIVSENSDELALAIEKYDRTITDKTKLALVIAPSLQCNMQCYYCYEGDKPDARLQVHDAEALTTFVRSRLSQNGKLSVTWFGGEPLMALDIVLEAARKLQELCVKANATYVFRMVSNGYLLDAGSAALLASHGITSVQVTFDGSQESHDLVRRSRIGREPSQPSFERIIANIRTASEYVRVLVRIHVSRINYTTIPLLIEQLAEADLADKVAGVYFYPVFNFNPADKSANYLPKSDIHFSMEQFGELEYRFIYLLLQHGFVPFTPVFFETDYLGCYASIENGFVIDYQGNIKKCDHELGDVSTGQNTIYDFSNIDNDTMITKWRALRPENYFSCRGCAFLPICYAHCPHSNLVLPDLEPRCPSYKYNWKEVFPIFLDRRKRENGTDTA